MNFMKENYLLPHGFKHVDLIILVPFRSVLMVLFMGTISLETNSQM